MVRKGHPSLEYRCLSHYCPTRAAPQIFSHHYPARRIPRKSTLHLKIIDIGLTPYSRRFHFDSVPIRMEKAAAT
jgi:hypothetical protein